MTLELNTEAIKLFTEIGFLGVSRGHYGAAEVIFSMVQAMRPGEESGAVGRAITALAADRADVAVQHLASADQTEAVMAFSVVALVRLGDRAKAAQMTEDLKDMECDEALLAMCEAAIANN